MTTTIGIFDSGFGGLTVYRELEGLSNYRFIYFADMARAPYGDKTTHQIQEMSAEIAEFLLSQPIQALMIACHTASTQAYDYLRSILPIPIVSAHLPTESIIKEHSSQHSFLILGTEATIRSSYYQNAIKSHNPAAVIQTIACPKIVQYIQEENENSDELESILDHYEIGKNPFDVILLACTHFPLIHEAIQKRYLPSTLILDPAKKMKEALLLLSLPPSRFPKDNDLFYVSGDTTSFEAFAGKVLGKTIVCSSHLNPTCVKI
jgi:glutamate racemase